jgi:hypothetical protein
MFPPDVDHSRHADTRTSEAQSNALEPDEGAMATKGDRGENRP